jgi:hypothetical protein
MKKLRWFQRVMWVGITANLAFAIPLLIDPAFTLSKIGVPAAAPLIWPRLAGLLMIVLNAFYMPAASDPVRYRLIAWLAVGSRFAGAVFFVAQGPPFGWLAAFDGVFFLLLLLLLPRGISKREACIS